jgi:hypothetical protein
MIGYLSIILVTCLTTTTLAMFCSVLFRKTSVSMMTSYLVVVVLFAAPVAVKLFGDVFFPRSEVTQEISRFFFTSPFAAAFSLPLNLEAAREGANRTVAQGTEWWSMTCVAFLVFYVWLDALLLWLITRLFHMRWRLAQQ